MQLILSLEDTNKIRQQLGLKLIPRETPQSRADELKQRALAVISQTGHKPLSRENTTTANVFSDSTESDLATKAKHSTETVKKSESTVSWIQRMKKLAASKDENTSVGPELPKSGPDLTSESNEISQTSMKRSLMPKTSEPSCDERESSSTQSLPDQSKPTESAEAKRATFRPKKIKTSASTRKQPNREIVKFSKTNKSETAHETAIDLAKLIAASRRTHIAKHDTKLDLNPTVNAVPAVGRSITKSLKALTETNRPLDINNSETPSLISKDAEHEEAEPDPTSLPQPAKITEPIPPVETSVGIADTLKRLKSRNTAPLTESSKSWARKLMESQKQREAEISAFMKKNAHLPRGEREKALEAHKEQLIHEQSTEANEFARNYRPNVDLDYRDSQGNLISSKQAFKQLSRAFHRGTR